ncbi:MULTISPECIES: hypothetical protein [Aurantimonas]|uniref:hypothetical protein n=1 Tax=Aurantimonas TaxID=182269 RepID=UPI003516CD4F
MTEMNGIESIAAERQRQVEQEGWTAEHDDRNEPGDLARAAACYAAHAAMPDKGRDYLQGVPLDWPTRWDWKWWKPKDRRADLVRAGALIAAEIDRLDRLAKARGA